MPEVFRFFGFSFFFYSKEHEPLHIHVEGNGGMAKFEWNGTEFVLTEKQGIKSNDFRKIKLWLTRTLTSSSNVGTNISINKGGQAYED